jgi:hypothetical protein
MKIYKDKKQFHDNKIPTFADPTRSLNGNEKFYLFPVQDIVMHHMCSIRYNLARKYENSTYNVNSSITEKIMKIKDEILKWNPEDNRLGESDYYLFGDKIVKKEHNKFNINLGDYGNKK